jgi:TRAP-type C4-dicarboxylate transport system permease large subunit
VNRYVVLLLILVMVGLLGCLMDSMVTIFKGVVPFIIADVCEIILLIAIPQITLFLPGLMTG